MMHSYLALRDTNFSLLPELWLMLDGCIPIYSWFVARLHAALAVKGVSDNHIQAAGHWASDAFRVYIRRHPMLLNVLIHSQTTL